VTTDLLAATADLLAIPSVSRDEAALADHVEARLAPCGWLRVERLGDNVIARTSLGRPRRVVIAGHLDTVPAAGNETPRIDGDILYGLGSADMKGGIAVMLDLATVVDSPEVDVTWCFYRGEEIERSENGLVHVFAERPELLAGDAAVLCEPTACLIEAGCQGSVRARITLGGKRAHSARPHLGRNAIHRMAPVLTRLTEWQPRTVTLDGCQYTERLQVVGIEGGVASNVVPDRATALVNFRFAPDRSQGDATAYLSGLFADLIDPAQSDTLEFLDVAGAAPPGLGDPLLARLLEATGQPPRAKLGWTDVATFTERGVPATNFGPGDPDLAHQAEEHVDRASLERARSSLAALLGAAT
jgi:succinyl-diaminopimelate desuccinylase